MDPDRWKQVEGLYYNILAEPLENRAAMLDRICGNDPELRRELESLIEAHDLAGDFLSPEHLHSQVKDLRSAPTVPSVGTTLGEYETLELLGSGGMGVVYRARDARLNRLVALKVLPSDCATDPARVSRFRREARAASTLSHPNIVTIYEIGQAGETWFIAAELIEGMNLRQRMQAGRIPGKESIAIALQCATALEAAHGAGIVHRDIKPENIMIRKDGVVKVVDFGLARLGEAADSESGSNHRITLTSAVIGTPRYMSPEQARGKKPDGRTDIFSLAAVLYEMVLGKPAIEGTTPPEIFAALLNPASSNPEASGPLGAVLGKALQRDPDLRFQSMAEFADALKAVDSSGDITTTLTVRPQTAVRRPVSKALFAAIASMLFLAGFVLYRRTPPAAGSDSSLQLVPLTAFPGAKDFTALSPDGSSVAFCWNGDVAGTKTRHIYVKPVSGGDPRQLSFGTDDDSRPAWSPDAREIAFLRRISRSELEIHVVPSNGGADRKIANGGDGVSWSPDGKSLAIAAIPRPGAAAGIHVHSLSDGQDREITNERNSTDSAPAWSPDGRWIAFLRSNPSSDVYAIPSSGGNPRAAKRLTSDKSHKLPRLAWTPDSREIIYSTAREYGGEGLWRVSLNGGDARRLSSTLLFAGNPSLSRTGNRLAYTESWIDTNIYVSRGSGFDGEGVPGGFDAPQKLIASSREDHSPSFSADGQRIAFVSNRTGHSEIWTSRLDGSEQAQLTHMDAFAGTPRWSPDGNCIAFDSIVGGAADIYVIPASGASPRRLTVSGEPNTKPSWSPDGKFIYFNTDRSGRPEVWKIAFAGGDAVQVTVKGGREPLPSSDGRVVYYTKFVGPSPVWSVPVAGGTEGPVAGMESVDSVGRAWGVLKQGVYFAPIGRDGAGHSIRYFSFAKLVFRDLAEWPGPAAWDGPAVALSPDGRTLLTVRTDQEINDLMMIENFR